jgi:DNA-directed RNA polymerase II subunit RPB9
LKFAKNIIIHLPSTTASKLSKTMFTNSCSSSSSCFAFIVTFISLILSYCSNNILWPEADRESKTLLYKCRNCPYQERADVTCVYKNEIKVAEPFHFHDVYADPALPRIQRECKKCHHKEACYFQSASIAWDEPMTLYYVCANPLCGFQTTDEKTT